MKWTDVAARLSRLEPPFPYTEVEEARHRWDVWGSHFIAVIERMAQGSPSCRDDGSDEFDGLFCFATWLAAEKRDVRAYAPLVRLCHCSDERAEELFADDLTDGLGRMLASVCDGDLAPLKALAEDARAGMWCRYAALQALLIRVVEGADEHDALLAWLEDFCVGEAGRVRCEDGQDDLLTWAVDIVCQLGPASLIGQIRSWFSEGLVDPQVRSLKNYERLATKSAEACLEQAGKDDYNHYVSDAVAAMEGWSCFQEEDDEADTAPAWLDRLMPVAGGLRVVHGDGTFKRDVPKLGRNDPCLCGSGKKFKKCCGKEHQENSEAGNGSSAVQRSLDWLIRHREDEMREAMRVMMTLGLDEEDEEMLANLDVETWQMIQVNMSESLIAEGLVWDEGDFDLVSVPKLLLGPDGPALSPRERGWIEKLASHPLRLYEVTDTTPGVRMTLCDAFDLDAPPVVVEEKSGSRMARIGMQLGARILPVDGHCELSGAVYPFSALHVPALMDELNQDREALAEDYPEDLPEAFSETIRRLWLLQYLRPAPLPTVVDTHSGDPLMFISDRYRVRDWPALQQALSTQEDIDGNPTEGWSRTMECADGLIRRRMSINPIEGKTDGIDVSYRTQSYANEGKPWFEALAGAAIEFIGRDIKDPKVAMMLGGLGEKPQAPPSDLPPEALADIIETTILRSYARWADEPIPALGNKTPRQAIQTAAGLERVKGLIRSYQQTERKMAAEHGRREISYEFLWDALGLRST